MKTKITSLRILSILMIFILSLSFLSHAQVVVYATGASGGAGPRISITSNMNTSSTSSSLVRVNCTTLGSPCTQGMSNSGAAFQGGFNFTSSGYITFTAYPNTGYNLNVTSFTVNQRRTGTGPVSGYIYYSIDGGTTWVNNGGHTIPSPSGCITSTGSGLVTWDMADFTANCTNGVIFRMYGYGASGSAGNFQLYSVSLNGSLSALSPSVSIAASANPSCAGDSVTFTATPTNGGAAPAYQWKVNGSNVGTNSPTYKTASLTNGQIVTCVLTSNLNCVSPTTATSAGITMTINPQATVNPGAAYSVCEGDSVALSGSVGGGASSATWSAPSGTFSNSSSLTSWYKPSISSGTVTLTLTSNDPSGPCPAVSGTVVVTVNSRATANAGSPQTICAGDSVSLSGTIGGTASSSTWSASSGTFSDATSLTSWYKPSISSGTVTLTLTTNDPSGPCPSAVSTVIITVNPVAIVDAGSNQVICSGGTVNLEGTLGGSASSAVWSAPSGTFSDSSSLLTVYTPSISSGMVTLTLTSNDPSGPCVPASSIMVVTINPPATANAGSPQTVCATDSVLLNGSIGGAASSASWSAPSGTFTNASALTTWYKPAIISGTVTLTLTTNNPSGPCPSVNSTVDITVNPPAVVNAGTNQILCAGSTINLAGSISGAASSSTWSALSGTFSDSSSLTSAYTPSVPSGMVALVLLTDDPAGLCAAVSDTVLFTYTSPATSIILADSSSNTFTLAEACEVSGWTYYANPTDANKWLFAIEWGLSNATAKAGAQVNIKVLNHHIVDEATRGTGAKDASYLMNRFWNVNLTGNSLVSPVNVRFYYDTAEITALTMARDNRMAVLNGLGPYVYYPVPLSWFKTVGIPFVEDSINDGNNFNFPTIDLTPTATDGVEGGVVYKQFNGVTSFSGGTAGMGFSPHSGIALPISLLAFTALKQVNGTTLLTWKTNTEINNKSFVIERSNDAIHFTTIHVVDGAGNSTEVKEYIAVDESPLPGMNYYRLKQIDYDGQSSYSTIKSVAFEDMTPQITIYPNPVKDILQISFSHIKEDALIKVYDIFGMLVIASKIEMSNANSSQSKLIDMKDFLAGTYMITIQSNGLNERYKLIKE